MYEADHPNSEHIGQDLANLIGWINTKVEDGTPVTVDDSRELYKLIGNATEEMIVQAVGASAARLYGIERAE